MGCGMVYQSELKSPGAACEMGVGKDICSLFHHEAEETDSEGVVIRALGSSALVDRLMI